MISLRLMCLLLMCLRLMRLRMIDWLERDVLLAPSGGIALPARTCNVRLAHYL
jgi:hypothetical protein